MYKMMTAKEVIDKLWEMPECNRKLDFTFDDLELEPDSTPEGWYGVKITQIFDEYYDVLALGYYGGGSTEVYDLDREIYNSDKWLYQGEDAIKQICIEKLQNFMNFWCDGDSCIKICVEIEEEEK